MTLSIGSVALIDKVDAEFGFFQHIFGKIGGKVKNLVASTKLFFYLFFKNFQINNHSLTGVAWIFNLF